jgi:nitrite reductase (NADH) large subunit
MDTPERLVIIGAGMATAYLLQALGAHAAGLEITVIGEEAQACYNRVLLSGLLAGEHEEKDLLMLEQDSPAAPANFLTGTRVQAIDLEGRTLHTDCGRSLGYDQLVIATGACVDRPQLAGTRLPGVTQLRALDDARQLRATAADVGRAVIVGGGLLGLEAAYGLKLLGVATTVVHRRPYLMNRQLDAEGARALQARLENLGIDFRLGANISSLESRQRHLAGVRLDNGDNIPCELLLFATGITPNAGLAARAGLGVQRGVIVDEQMRTSDPRVSALGECSQFGEHCFGLVAPIREQAQVLARRLSAQPGPAFCLVDNPTQLKISGIDIYSAGDFDGAGEQLVLRDAAAGIYRRLVLREQRLVGAVLVGDKRGGTWYSELIRNGTDISEVRPGLMFGRDVSENIQQTARAA